MHYLLKIIKLLFLCEHVSSEKFIVIFFFILSCFEAVRKAEMSFALLYEPQQRNEDFFPGILTAVAKTLKFS